MLIERSVDVNNPHAKENETGEKLYGMPLEDILTPEQLLDLQKQRRESVRNKPGRRNRKQKKSFYIKIFERITSFFNDVFLHFFNDILGIT